MAMQQRIKVGDEYLDIIERGPAETPLSTPTKRVFYKQVEQLLLSDGSVMYGCIHCNLVAESGPSVGNHVKKHNMYINVAVAKMSVGELMDVAHDSLSEGGDRYEALYRQVKAENTELKKELKDYKRKLGAVSALFKDEEK